MNVRDQLTRAPDTEIVRRLGDDGDPDLAAVIYEAGKRRLAARGESEGRQAKGAPDARGE